MKIYLSIGGGKKINRFVVENNLGWCISPTAQMNPKGKPFFLDNGAFKAWEKKEPWNETAFKVLVSKYPGYDFVIAPDIVCGGIASLRQSLKYLGEIPGPMYLAVQDGMNQQLIRPYVESFDGLFVGGSLGWKFKTALDWANLAHFYGKKCHVGRVNQYEGLRFMHFCGVDSVDGSTASRHDNPAELKKYFNHLKYQQTLAGRAP